MTHKLNVVGFGICYELCQIIPGSELLDVPSSGPGRRHVEPAADAVAVLPPREVHSDHVAHLRCEIS